MSEATVVSITILKRINDFEINFHDGQECHLGNSIPRFDPEIRLATIPARHFDFTLVIAVDQSHQIT